MIRHDGQLMTDRRCVLGSPLSGRSISSRTSLLVLFPPAHRRALRLRRRAATTANWASHVAYGAGLRAYQNNDAIYGDGWFAFETRNPCARQWEDWRPENVFEITDVGGQHDRGKPEVKVRFSSRGCRAQNLV